MKTFRVVLEYTITPEADVGPLYEWDWHDLLDIDGVTEEVSLIECEEIPVNEGHRELLGDINA